MARDAYETYEEFRQLVQAGASRVQAAAQLGYAGWSPLRMLLKRHGLPTEVIVEAPAHRISARTARRELVERRKAQYAVRGTRADDHSTVSLHVPLTGPIGLLVMGDPHVDDDGTDLALMERHIALVRETDGAYASVCGDYSNNWCGRLARLYSEQSTSAAEAWELVEWFFEELGDNLLWAVGGNHDLWSGAGDPVKWIARHNNTVYEPWDIVVSINTPDTNGRPFTVNMKHSFKGNSQWNTCHAIAKAAQLGTRYDLLTAGHTHVSGYQVVKDAQSGQLIHCLQVASYKIHDRYAKEMGLQDKAISPSAFVIFDPSAGPAGRVNVFHDVEMGIRVLSALRQGCEVE